MIERARQKYRPPTPDEIAADQAAYVRGEAEGEARMTSPG